MGNKTIEPSEKEGFEVIEGATTVPFAAKDFVKLASLFGASLAPIVITAATIAFF